MVNINILSLNVRGLHSPIKRTRVLDLMHRKKIDVAFLQETHLTATDTQRMQNRRYIPIISSSCKSKKQGVTILFKRNSNFIEIDIHLLIYMPQTHMTSPFFHKF